MPQSSVDQIVAANLGECLKANGKSAYAVATALGHAPNWLYRVVNGQAGILLPTLREVAEELGVTVGSLVDRPEDQADISEDVVELVEVEASVNSGAEIYDETFRRRISYSRTLLGDMADQPLVCQFLRVKGDAMAPTLPDGSLILVDRLSREWQDGKVYVMETEFGLVARRVKLDENVGWAILEHEREDAVPIPPIGTVNTIGQVRQVVTDL